MTDLSFIDNSIKEALIRELKDNYSRYTRLLQRWFKHQLSKEDFDKQARALFPNSDVSTHNRFILSIMSSCQVVDPALSGDKQGRVSKNLKYRFKELPQMPLIALISEYQMAHAKQSAFDHGKKDFSVVTTSCVREQRLPGSWMLYGRLMNTLQLYAMHDFTPDALNCLAEATQRLVRRVLLSALAGRRCCRLVPAATAASGAADLPASEASDRERSEGRQQLLQQQPPLQERVSFGRVPIPQLSMGAGFVAATRAERLNAFVQAWTPQPPATAVAAAAAAASGAASPTGPAAEEAPDDWERPEEVEQRLRVQALLRCDGHAPAPGIVLGLGDLHRALTCPDSHLVGYQCVQREYQAVASHFVRFLSQSRTLSRLHRRQLKELADCDLAEPPSLGLGSPSSPRPPLPPPPAAEDAEEFDSC